MTERNSQLNKIYDLTNQSLISEALSARYMCI